MITIRDISETPCHLYDPDNNLVGVIESYLSLVDVRIQIKNAKIGGYYITWKHDEMTERIDINANGELGHWPIGFFDALDKMLTVLIGWDDI